MHEKDIMKLKFIPIILGLFMLISVNLGKVTQDIVSKLEIRLFLKPNLTI